jgi:hypothetical protein
MWFARQNRIKSLGVRSGFSASYRLAALACANCGVGAMSALISPDGIYRYLLERNLSGNRDFLVIMLNPSTADANKNDPTITRLVKRTRDMGSFNLQVANLFAYRSPYPDKLWQEWARLFNIIGPENDRIIETVARNADKIAIAWGRLDKRAIVQEEAMLETLYSFKRDLYCWGHTSEGFPRHPLHLSYATPLFRYTGRFAR